MIIKESKKTMGMTIFVHYLDCSDSFMGLYIYQNISKRTLNMCNLPVNYTSPELVFVLKRACTESRAPGNTNSKKLSCSS
jgi:hypothetical protein